MIDSVDTQFAVGTMASKLDRAVLASEDSDILVVVAPSGILS